MIAVMKSGKTLSNARSIGIRAAATETAARPAITLITKPSSASSGSRPMVCAMILTGFSVLVSSRKRAAVKPTMPQTSRYGSTR